MKTEILAVQKAFRACKVRKAHHQIGTRRAKDALLFVECNPLHAAKLLAEARDLLQFAQVAK